MSDISNISIAYEHALSADISENTDEVSLLSFTKLDNALSKLKHRLSMECRTARLWIFYLYYIQTLKLFIRAERLGDWSMHLLTVHRMLNLIAVSGHN